jgi:hypothetical protein
MSDIVTQAQAAQISALYEEYLLAPCKTKEELNQWIQTFLNISFPNFTVDENSTSNPLDFIWDVYSAVLSGDSARTTFVGAASRAGMKCLAEGTLVAAPSGSVPIERMKVGDIVYDEHNKPIKVIGVWDQGEQECVDLLSDNQLIATCTEDHRWLVKSINGETSVKRVRDFTFGDCVVNGLVSGGDFVITDIVDSGRVHCWDITVQSNTSLYLLQNGMVTHNTLSVSVLEFLLMLHFGKSIVHLSAILDQSMACIGYLDNFLALPAIKKFSKTDSQRKKILRGMPANEFRSHLPASLRVLVATKESANGMRGNVLCVPGDTRISIAGTPYCTARELYNRVESGEQAEVLTVNLSSFEFEYKKVVKGHTRKTPERIKLTTKDGDSVTVTPEHPVAVCSENRKAHFAWIKAADLDVSDCLFVDVSDSTPWPSQLVDIQRYTEAEDLDVFDFTVEDNHNFFANDVLLHNCLDEVDLIDPSIISEAAMIADPDQLGRPPIFIYISSRKSAFGPVQDKIDESSNPESGVRLHKWSLADFMQRCPPEIYKPDEPRPTVYIHRDSLEIKSEEDYKLLPSTMQIAYDKKLVYTGCVTCPALLVCQARSVNQQSQPSKALRNITFVKTVLRETKDPEKIKAQLLNLKPESSGNVFNRFERAKQTGSIEQAWEFAFGVPWQGGQLTKRYLREMLSANDWYVTAGVDFGYVDPAVSILVAHHRAFDKVLILHALKAQGFSNPDWLAYTKERMFVPYGFDLLCPDTADKSAPNTAAKLGMQARSRKPHRIDAGISWLQNHIWSPTKQTHSLFIIEDEMTRCVIDSIERYQYKRGSLGFVYDTYDPDSPYSHEIDALRYACDPWVVYSAANVSSNQPKPTSGVPLYYEHQKAKEEALRNERKYLMTEIRQHYSDEYSLTLDMPVETADNETAEGSHGLYFSF